MEWVQGGGVDAATGGVDAVARGCGSSQKGCEFRQTLYIYIFFSFINFPWRRNRPP